MQLISRSFVHRAIIAATEYVFALAGGVAGVRARFPRPPDGDTAEGKGRLAVRQGCRFLHLEGAPYEMGLQQGRLLGPVIGRALDAYLGGIRLFRWMDRAELLRRGRRLEAFIPAAYREEMRGIAAGAGMPYDDILIGHTFLESIQCVQCSCYAAYGASTRNGEVIFGRNLDFMSMGFAHLIGVISFVKPDGGIPFLSVAWPGWAGTLTAVNLRGLCVGMLNVPRLRPHTAGLPYALLFRRMAQEAATCDEAVALLRATARTYSNNVLLAQTAPVRQAVVAEYTPEEVVVREVRPGEEYIAATNHFRQLARRDAWPDDRGFSRYPRIIRALRRHAGRLDVTTDIFTDPHIHLVSSLHTLIAAPESRQIRVALGRLPAAAGPYRRLTYDENGLQVPPLPGR